MLVGQKIGPFKVEKELGSGAMGTVYRATNSETGQRVAIKMVSPALGTSEQSMARFKREASILKQLDHPNIVKYVASGRVAGAPFYAMEYVDGESLDQVMSRRGRLSWEEVVTIGQQLCAGLQHAHEKGIIHRDLKPSNLMILPDGTVKLTDFGIAKDMDVTALTAANSTVGTASYMSPEQCRGDRNISSKSDLYSMGVMFYELVTGRKPFQAESAMEMFNKHTSGTFERPSRLKPEIPIWLDTLVCQLMEKKPEKRPYDAAAVARALEQVKQKVVAQSSAGLEAAKRRRIDKTDLMPALDETDKEAARTLLHKKKKKVKLGPIYQRVWFRAAVLSLVLLAISYILYAAFFKIPSPETLYQQAASLMASGPDSRNEARGALEQFLEYYPEHEQAKQIQAWVDQVDIEENERPMHNRRGRFNPENELEKFARAALTQEDAGMLQDALKTWGEIASNKNKVYKTKQQRSEERPWALVAEKYANEILRTHQLRQSVEMKLKEEVRQPEKKFVWDSEEEQLAFKAFKAQLQGKRDEAKLHLETLKSKTEEYWRSPDATRDNLRLWYLIATSGIREVSLASSLDKKDGGEKLPPAPSK
jgi:serine/threonine-protein kinase